MRIAACLFPFILFSATTFSQLNAPQLDTGALSLADRNAITFFQQKAGFQKDIYYGPEHIGYVPSIKGFAYFASKDWLLGSVLYDGILYENQLLKFDLLQQKLVLKRYDGFAIELRNDKLGFFYLLDQTFISVQDNAKIPLKEGIYNRLTSGPITILARHIKILEDKIEQTTLSQRFEETITFYAVKNNQVHLIKSADAVLDLTESKKREIQAYLKKKRIKFKKDRILTLTTIADYYNKTQP